MTEPDDSLWTEDDDGDAAASPADAVEVEVDDDDLFDDGGDSFNEEGLEDDVEDDVDDDAELYDEADDADFDDEDQVEEWVELEPYDDDATEEIGPFDGANRLRSIAMLVGAVVLLVLVLVVIGYSVGRSTDAKDDAAPTETTAATTPGRGAPLAVSRGADGNFTVHLPCGAKAITAVDVTDRNGAHMRWAGKSTKPLATFGLATPPAGLSLTGTELLAVTNPRSVVVIDGDRTVFSADLTTTTPGDGQTVLNGAVVADADLADALAATCPG